MERSKLICGTVAIVAVICIFLLRAQAIMEQTQQRLELQELLENEISEDFKIPTKQHSFRGLGEQPKSKDLKELIVNVESSSKLLWLQEDPEMYMNASQLIRSKGMPSEEHFVQTADGYILGMQRIPQPSSNRLPVLLMHGLLSSSDCFLTNLVNESLAYILYNAGYDVWLGNVRGNTYSKKHVRLSPDDIKFWSWSFDEMGKYDIPAMVDHVLKETGYEKLDYVGHSQGTTCMLTAAISQGQKFANKINSFVALAFAGLVPDMRSPLHYLTYVANDIDFFYTLFGDGDFLPHSGFISKIAKYLCPNDEHLCENVLFLFGGTDMTNTNKTRVPVYTAHNPAGTSTQNMIHWAQMVKNKSDKLIYYDYGHWYLNMWHYKSIHPPTYDLSTFNVPTYVFCGGKDTLVVPGDCEKLISILPNVKDKYFIPAYTHLDFIWAINSAPAVYDTVLRILSL